MKTITMDYDLYLTELKNAEENAMMRGSSEMYWKGYHRGRENLFQNLRIIQELVQGYDPDQALELITGSYEGEDRDLLIKIFKLEEAWKEWGGEE